MNSNTPLKYTRLATLRDVPVIVELVKHLVNSTGYHDIACNGAKAKEMVEAFIIGTPAETLMIVSTDEKGQVVGFLAGTSFELLHSSEPIALEVGWYTNPQASDYNKRHMELRATYEEWARRKGVRYAQYAILNPTVNDFKEREKNSKTTILELVYMRDVRKEI